jgi:hypothetical protein
MVTRAATTAADSRMAVSLQRLCTRLAEKERELVWVNTASAHRTEQFTRKRDCGPQACHLLRAAVTGRLE